MSSPKHWDENLEALFAEIDTDSSGSLERNEILQLSKDLGKNWTSKDLDEAMKAMDTDSDGKISLSEFQSWWSKNKNNPDSLAGSLFSFKKIGRFLSGFSRYASVPANKNKVVVVGAGFGGKDAIIALEKIQGIDLTVIEKETFIFNSIGSIRCLVDSNFAHTICIPVSNLVKKGQLVCGEVISISDTEVTIADGRTFPFDACVVATGSDYAFPFKPGNTPIINATDGVTNIVNMLQNISNEVKAAKSVAIIGGGAVGVEAAGEIKQDNPGIEVTLVHRHLSLISKGSWFKEGFVVKAQENLRKLGVKLLLGYTVTSPENVNQDYLRGPVKISACPNTDDKNVKAIDNIDFTADLVFFCTGSTISTDTLLNKTMSKCMNDIGQYKVDEYLQIKGRNRMFAIGDCCDSDDPKMAMIAGEQGKIVAYNVVQLLNSSSASMKTWKWNKPRAMIVTTGRNGGSAQLPLFGGKLFGDKLTRIVKGKDFFAGKMWADYGAGKSYKKDVKRGHSPTRGGHAHFDRSMQSVLTGQVDVTEILKERFDSK